MRGLNPRPHHSANGVTNSRASASVFSRPRYALAYPDVVTQDSLGFVGDLPLEGGGFELSVPGERAHGLRLWDDRICMTRRWRERDSNPRFPVGGDRTISAESNFKLGNWREG